MLRTNISEKGPKSPYSSNYKSKLPYAALREKQTRNTKEMTISLNTGNMMYLSI